MRPAILVVLLSLLVMTPAVAAPHAIDLRGQYDICVLKASLGYLKAAKHDGRIRATVAGKCASQMKKVRAELLRAGYREAEVDKALGRMQEGAFRAAAAYIWTFVLY